MHARTFASLFLALLSSGALAADARLDGNGDPLPEGAIARFGSARLLHGGVEHVEVSPDGKTLASSGRLGVRLWDTATGKLIACAHLPQWSPAVFAFTPDGGHLIGDAEGCRLIDPRSGKVRRSWRHGSRMPASIVVATDGKTAAVGWEGGGVTVHDLTDHGADWKLSDDVPHHLCLSSDGRRLAYFRRKEEPLHGEKRLASVLLWDAQHGNRLHAYGSSELEGQLCSSLCLSRDGRRLAVALGDKVLLWDTTSHAALERFVPPREAEPGFLRFSPDGSELWGVSRFREVWRWSAATGEQRFHFCPRTPEQHAFWHPTLSPDGRVAAGAADANGILRFWDAATGKDRVAVERGPAWGEAVFGRSGVVATCSGGAPPATVAFWEAKSGRLLRKHVVRTPTEEGWRRALSPDGTLLAADGKMGVRLLEVETGKQVRMLDALRAKHDDKKFAFGLDGKRLVAAGARGRLRIWDVTRGRVLHTVQGIDEGAMALSPDGRTVASALVGELKITEIASDQVRFRMPLPTDKINREPVDVVGHLRYAGDGRSVVTVSPMFIYVFSAVSGKPLLRLEARAQGVSANETGALSPQGRWLAHADNSRQAVCVRDLQSAVAAHECQTLYGHAADVADVAFPPDGRYLVSCSSDGTALVWDARRLTGKPNRSRAAPPVADVAPLGSPDDSEWEALAGDAGKAGRAMAALSELPAEAVALCKGRLQPAPLATVEQIDKLVADLDSAEFEVRQKALQELRPLAEQAVPALRKALQGKPSAELARQAKPLLKAGEDLANDPTRLRQIRAVEVLERIGTPAARQVLETLAKGAPSARLTREAKASLERWPAKDE